MRNLFFILISIVLFNFSSQSVRKTDLDITNLKGNVKSWKTFQYKAIEKNGKIEKTKVDNSGHSVSVDNQLEFDKNGMITEQRKYISDNLVHKFIYTYDDQLNILNKDLYDSSGNLLAESKFENSHNLKGELIEEIEFITGKNVTGNWTHKFFENNNEVRKIEGWGNEASKIFEYTYDKNGRVIEEIWKSSNGEIYIKTIREYENGNLSLESLFDSNDSLISISRFKYLDFDHENNWTKILVTENDKLDKIIEAKIEYYN
jgi:hypothetical protein